MAMRLPKFQLIPTLVVGLALASLVGAGYLARAPHRSAVLSAHVTPAPSVSPSPTPTSTATPTPEASAAPVAAASSATAISTAATPHPVSRVVVPAPTPTPAPTITLGLIYPGVTTSFSVKLLPGADACSVLTEAKAEGKLSSLTIDYSYLQTSLKSAYVREINSYENNWTVKVNGASPRGCSLVYPQINDNVTWRYQ